MEQNSNKALVSAASTAAALLLALFGSGVMPSAEQLGELLLAILGVVGAGGVAGALTWRVPNKPKQGTGASTLRSPVLVAGLALAAMTLGGCDLATNLRSDLYATGAHVGNKYCDSRDEGLRDQAIARINAGLRVEGAAFTFDGITCDPPGVEETEGAGS